LLRLIESRLSFIIFPLDDSTVATLELPGALSESLIRWASLSDPEAREFSTLLIKPDCSHSRFSGIF